MAKGESSKMKDAEGHDKVKCEECGKYYHRVDVHVVNVHGTINEYEAAHPGAPLMSERAKKVMEAANAPSEKTDEQINIGAARLTIRRELAAEDLPFIPMHDEGWALTAESRTQWEAMGIAVQENEPVLLVGPTGCGKSAGVLELAAILNQPVRRVNLHGDVRAADFLGEKVVEIDPTTKESVVVWRDGVLPTAIRKGQWLLLDEMDAAPPQILFVLQGLLEKGGSLVLTGNGGEVVRPHPNFRVLATANTLGRGDESGLYAGTNILNEAFLDRFGVVVECDYPKTEQEVEILINKNPTLNPTTAKQMVEVANLTRESFKREECTCTFSTRRLLGWARKTVIMGGDARKASKMAVLNKLIGDDRRYLDGLMQRVFSGEISK